ncbi:TetR/AcrR family transcriptional regulator [Anaeromicropila herbilytica]|uniref:HTH tetR-type domain-containing protein n=1 Tax=Anaeromicropila herbilytica TaxID=2785025 RepID=A0A7R7IBT1_9FIRM|nr:TetR/AcrR family transcriptional regulator [Anaeromicropila herbilytica]BCN29164.1 hypothetical protein bsdtb5_04590 [Anaeromicropila herbilytica]
MPKSKERCQEIREEMREKILHESMLFFARNGFAGTKISDLSKYIGIGQGTIYAYFQSKEELFNEITKRINYEQDVKELKMLTMLPITAKHKIHKLTESIMKKLENDENYAAKVTLNTQMLFEEKEYASVDTTYRSDLYKYTAKIIKQGQKEGSVVLGNEIKLTDYYWSIVYLYSLKKLFTAQYESISIQDLERILLKDGIKNNA